MDRLKVIKRNTEDNKITVVISNNKKKIKRRLMPVASNFFKALYPEKEGTIEFFTNRVKEQIKRVSYEN